MRIVFMGSADFGIPALQMLVSKGHKIAGVVSTPAKPQGRGRQLKDSPVTQYAKQNNLGPIFTPEKLKDPDFLAWLGNLDADIYVVVAFRILPREVFSIPKYGTVNIHASLLPRFRGPAPIQRSIEAGEKKTGITIFQIDTGIDTGKVILTRETSIGETETTPELYERLSMMGAEGIVEALDCIERGDCSAVKQNEGDATRAPKLKKEESFIDWGISAEGIFNRIRAFKPFPGTATKLQGRRLGIEWATPSAVQYQDEPGTIVEVDSESFTVSCKDGSLRVTRVKPEGKKAMDAGAFMRGNAIRKGQKLG